MRVLLSIVLISLALHGTSATELRTAAENHPPKYYLEDGKMKGIAIDIINAIEAMDPSIKFSGQEFFQPLPRIIASLQENKLDVFFGLIKTLEREANITYIHTPLYYTGLIFIVRTNDEIVDIKSFDDIRRLGTDGRILSIGGTAEVAQLNGVGGLLVDDSPKSGEMNLQMLVRKRGRLAYLTDLEAAILIPKKNLTNDVRILPTVFSREARYLGISKQVPAETVERLRTDLAILENNGTLAKIIKDYNKMLPGDK